MTSQPRLDYLISKGADINARDSLGNTPLFLVDYAGLDWADNLLTSPQLGKFMNHVNFKIPENSFAEDFIFKGRADACYCYANSRGTLQFEDFEVKRLVIGYAGNRNTTVTATESIDAILYHTGNVYYKGNPSNIATTFYSTGRLFRKP